MKYYVCRFFYFLFRLLIYLIKIFVGLMVTLFASYFSLIAGVISCIGRKEFDWQILLYTLISIGVIMGIWILFFRKTKNLQKLVYLILLTVWLVFPHISPSVMRQIDYDTCIDTGICAEGIRFESGVMNKEYCLEQGKIWNGEKKECNMNNH